MQLHARAGGAGAHGRRGLRGLPAVVVHDGPRAQRARPPRGGVPGQAGAGGAPLGRAPRERHSGRARLRPVRVGRGARRRGPVGEERWSPARDARRHRALGALRGGDERHVGGVRHTQDAVAETLREGVVRCDAEWRADLRQELPVEMCVHSLLRGDKGSTGLASSLANRSSNASLTFCSNSPG